MKGRIDRPNEELGVLSEENFREYAQKAIKTYEEKNMVIDAIVWSGIIAHYNRALDAAGKKK